MKRTGAALAIWALEQIGVRYTFGIPGVQNTELYDELASSQSITPILVTHEGGAAFMADAMSRQPMRHAAFCSPAADANPEGKAGPFASARVIPSGTMHRTMRRSLVALTILKDFMKTVRAIHLMRFDFLAVGPFVDPTPSTRKIAVDPTEGGAVRSFGSHRI
jgi:hypothetical protein